MPAPDPRGLLKALAEAHGLTVTSETRPGARTNTGRVSDHAVGRAIDVAGPPERMQAFADAVAARHPQLVKQLIYGGRLFQGGRWSQGKNLGHHDHVHVAWNDGDGGDELGGIAAGFLERGSGPKDDLDRTASAFLSRKPQSGKSSRPGAIAGADRAAPGADPDPLDRVAGDFLKRQPKAKPTATAPTGAAGLATSAAGLKGRPIQLSPQLQNEQARQKAEDTREGKLGGLFPTGSASGGTGASMQTFGKAIFKVDDAANAAAAFVARNVHKKGAAALVDPQTYTGAAKAGESALTDLHRETPPTAVRDLLGMKRGKTNRAAYNTAAVLDYVTSGLLSPSNAMVGPLFEAAAPLVKGAVKLTGKAALRSAEKVAPGATRAAVRTVKIAGEKLRVGAEARAGRQAQKSLDIDLGARMQDAGQIVREARDTTLRLRKKSPTFDQAEKAFAEKNGGKSRLQHLVERFQTDPTGTLKEARQLGIDPGTVKHYGARARTHASETLGRLRKHGVKVPATEQSQFRTKYVQQMFSRGGEIQPVKQAAVADLTERLTAEGVHVAPVTPGGPIRPGWAAVPNDPATFGKMAGQQAPKPVIRLIEEAAKEGPPADVLSTGGKVLRMWENVVGTIKAGYLANPATLSMNLGSNAILAELGARRAGVNPAKILAAMPAAIKETAVFLKTRKMSKDIAEFSRYSRGFTSTEASTAGLASDRGTADVAGTGGRIFRLGTSGPAVHIPPAREVGARALNSLTGLHGASEQASKLAMFKALKPKVGAERAAALVDQHLFDYSERGAALAALDRLGGWAFNTFPLKALELALDTIQTRPDLLLRYPRLARLIREDMGATDELRDLPEARQGPLSVPIGEDGRWADFSRAFPFADALALPDTVARIAGGGGTTDDLLAIARRTIPGAAVANLGFNTDLMSGKPVAKPGLPPDEAMRARGNALVQSYAPPLLSRQIPGLMAAAEGQPARGGVLAEPETLGESISRNVFGVPIARPETFDQKKARLGDATEARAEVAGELVAQMRETLAAEGGDGFPELQTYLQQARQYRDYGERQQVKRQAEQRMWELQRDAAIFRGGELTEDGRAKLRRFVTWLWALEQQ